MGTTGSCAGIYAIKNIVARKAYFGQSQNIGKRIRNHFAELRRGRHANQHLQRAWNRDGPNAFDAEVVATCDEREDRDALEMAFLCGDASYEGFSADYNIVRAPIGTTGLRHSNETKEKMRRAKEGAVYTKDPAYRATLSAAQIKRNLGRPEYVQKLRVFFDALRAGVARTTAARRAGLCPKRTRFFIKTYGDKFNG